MKPTACPRLFEAEARRDGRLADGELYSFERHLSSCAVCAHEVQALAALALPLGDESASRADVDELHVRRERARLLATFTGGTGATAGAPERRTQAGSLWLLTAASALVVVAGWAVFWHVGPAAPPQPIVRATVHAELNAVWSTRMQGERELIILERGALSIHVDHRAPLRPPRLLVVLPDGELEDTGTTFTVSARDGHTTHVTVQEGSVLLRVRAQLPVQIVAGDSWSAPSREAEPACASPAPPAETAGRKHETEPEPATMRPPAAPDPARDFRVAMAAFKSGKQRVAAAAFAGFLATHPRDARAEDAAYMQVIALQKLGATAETLRAAQHYLELFPAGLRRADVERLAAVPEPNGVRRE